MKKLLPLLLLLILTACLLPSAIAEEEPITYKSGDYEYILLNDGSAEIISCANQASVLEIPSQLEGYNVTFIGDDAFDYCRKVILTVEPDSYEEGWAIENGIAYNYTNSIGLLYS